MYFTGTQEEAAEAYDIAAIKFRGISAVTNFDISRYDVEKILASNSPAAGELARQNKEAVGYNNMVGHQEDNSGAVTEWKMALYQTTDQQQQQQEQNASFESTLEKSMNAGDHHQQKPIFSMALQNLIGMDSSINSVQAAMNEPNKLSSHFSTPSSLVSSLSNSREASPDKTGVSSTMVFGSKPTLETKFLIPTTNNVNACISSSPQLRSPIPLSMAHLPLFAAWNDS